MMSQVNPKLLLAHHKKKLPLNPYTNNLLDLRGIPKGTLVRDPNDPDPTHLMLTP